MELFKNTNFDFLGKEMAVHHCLAGADGAWFWKHSGAGRIKFGIDFKGAP